MIHHQNGYQKSQDTVVLFAKSELTKHVVSGGGFAFEYAWNKFYCFV